MSRSVATALAAVLLCAAASSAPADPASPPVFSPNPSVGWVVVLGGFKPPASGPGPIVADPKYPNISNNQFRLTGKQPTLPLADLTNPILQPWVRDALAKRNAEVLAGENVLGPPHLCWPRGVPGFLLEGGFQPIFIAQGAKMVSMVAQADNHQLRRIHMNVAHPAHVKPSWFGDSVGHYEGDTLVVDTIGLSPRAYIDDFQTPHSDKLHVVERYRLIDGGKQLEVKLYVEDEGAFTTPWSAIQRFRRAEPGEHEYVPVVEVDATSGVGVTGPLQEAICSDATSHFEHNAGIPQSATSDF
jgi:hypothetical protein